MSPTATMIKEGQLSNGNPLTLAGEEKTPWYFPRIDPIEIQMYLAWYRSRDLEKVTRATHWFVSIDIQSRLKVMVEDIRSGDLDESENAKRGLAAFSELGLKTVLRLLEDPELHQVAIEILSAMDENVLPHLLRWLHKQHSYNARIGILLSLTGHIGDFRARKALADGLASEDPIESALVFRKLQEAGSEGHRIISVVYRQPEEMVA